MEFESGAVSPVGSIEKGWAIIKDDYWIFFGMTLVAFVIIIVAAVILGMINNIITFAIASVFGLASAGASEAGRIGMSIAPQFISLGISLFTNVLVTTLSGVLFCGIYSALSRKSNSGVADFGDLFSGFQKIVPCLIFAVAMSVAQFVIGAVMLVIGATVGVSAIGLGALTRNGEFNPAVFGGVMIFVLGMFIAYLIVTLIISALTSFAYPLIAERNLSGMEALMLSIRSGLSNLGGLLVLLILMGLMTLGGLLACLVGVLFVAPILSASLFAAYQSVFGRIGGYGRQQPPPPPVFRNQPGY